MALVAGRYALQSLVGQGGQGLAWRARDLDREGMEVVLKFAPTPAAGNSSEVVREFSLLTRLSAPNLLRVHDLGVVELGALDPSVAETLTGFSESHRWIYLSRPYIDGQPLNECVLQLDEGLRIARQIGGALWAVHRQGLVHGDVKGPNVILSEQGDAWLIDMGLGGEAFQQRAFQGTPEYMAPELWEGSGGDGRAADVYAFALMTLESLTKTTLAPRGELASVGRAHRQGIVVEPIPGVVPRIMSSLQRALAVRPEERPEMAELMEALLTEGRPDGSYREAVLGFHPLPFLGRESELESLSAWVHRREGGVFWLWGNPRQGKSRLLEALKWRLQLAGFKVVQWSQARGDTLEALVERLNRAHTYPLQLGHGDRAQRFAALADGMRGEAEELCILLDDIDFMTKELRAWIEWLDAHPKQAGRSHWVVASRLMDSKRCGQQLELGGLSWASLEPWFCSLVEDLGEPTRVLEEIKARVEGAHGHPVWVQQLAEHLIKVHDLSSMPAHVGPEVLPQQVVGRWAALASEASLLALGLVAIFDGAVSLKALNQRIGAQVEQGLGELLSIDLLEIDWGSGMLRPAQPALWESLEGVLPQKHLVGAAAQAAQWLEEGSAPVGSAVQHLRLLVRIAQMAHAPPRLLQRAKDLWPRVVEFGQDRRHRGKALNALVELMAWGRGSLAWGEQAWRLPDEIADLAQQGGEEQEVLEHLNEVVLEHADGVPRAVLLHVAWVLARVRLASALGQHQLAEAWLGQVSAEQLAMTQAHAPALLGAWRTHRAELWLRNGRYHEAHDEAEQAQHIAEHLDASMRAQLEMTRGAALVFLGAAEAEAALAKAEKLADAADGVGLRPRLATYKGIAASRRGALDEAVLAYQQALDAAEREGLRAQLPTYLLNLGTAYHRQGKLGLAREYYARGARMSSSSTRNSTRCRLLLNGANLDIQLGRFDEAAALLQAAQGLLGSGSSSLLLLAQMLEADLLAQRQLYREAGERFRKLAQAYRDLGDSARQAEALLKAARCSTQLGTARLSETTIQEASRLLGSGDSDLQAKLDLERARLLLLEEGEDSVLGLERYQKSLERAAQQGDHVFVLSNAGDLVKALERAGLEQPQRQLKALTEAAWQAISAHLNARMQREFLATLPLLPLAQRAANPAQRVSAPSVPLRSSGVNSRLQLGSILLRDARAHEELKRLQTLLAFNGEILRSERPDELLPHALELCLSLTGAGRSFILLPQGRELELKAQCSSLSAEEEHTRYSLTIAHQVAREGRVIRLGRADPMTRPFNTPPSIAALGTGSALAVPIFLESGRTGALYLDHPHKPDCFDDEAERLTLAFADQLGLTLAMRQQVEALELARAEAETANRKIKALLVEKEALLEELSDRCEVLSQQVSENLKAASIQAKYKDIIAQAPASIEVLQRVERVVESQVPVIILGESGTGKEVIARAIHFNGPRATRPFIALNCGAVSESLLESELFGHVSGAFTDGKRAAPGLFRAAEGGTLFLDELGEMPLSMQVKLLRVLQERQVRPVGSTKTYPIDARILAATNRDLADLVRSGQFRQDLYYRIAGLTIKLAPLRGRREDIVPLASFFLEKIAQEEAKAPLKLDRSAQVALTRAPWPGNVRQLENLIRTACVLSAGEFLGASLIQELLQESELSLPPLAGSAVSVESMEQGVGQPARPARRRRGLISEQEVAAALEQSEGYRLEAAQRLGISERSLYRYLRRYGLG